MKNTCKITVLLCLLSGVAYSAAPVKEMILPGKVRDFREYQNIYLNGSTQLIAGGHPDFNRYAGNGCSNAVENKIEAKGQSTVFPNDNRNPKFITYNPCLGTHFTGETEFDSWYKDYGTAVNRPFLVPLRFTFYDDCVMRLSNNAFFPVDDGKEMYTLRDPLLSNTSPGAGTFGHLQTDYPNHNFGFTLEFHTTFTYFQGQHQVFNFTGDDDVWVFINDSLVIDLGGLSMGRTASVDLDNLPSGFLQNNQQYNFDFFFAERRSPGSNVQISTSILFHPEYGGDTIVNCGGQSVAIGTPVWPPAWYTDWKTPSIGGAVLLESTSDPLEGVVVSFSGGVEPDTTDYSGNFGRRVPAGWSGTVTPSKPGYSFTPASRSFSNVLTPQPNIFFRGVDARTPVVRLTSPNGGEQWAAGSTQKIAWDSVTNNGTIKSRSIYWRKLGQSWQRIDSSFSNGAKGTWSWILPADTTDLCWIKICFADAAGNQGVDSSDAPFRIKIAPHFTGVDTATATAGQNFRYDIALNNPFGGPAKLQLLPGGPSWVRLTIPSTLIGTPPSGEGSDTVRVTLAVDDIVEDTLDLVITRKDPNVSVSKSSISRNAFGLRQVGSNSKGLSFVADLVQSGTYAIKLRDVHGRALWSHSLTGSHPGSYQFQLSGQYSRSGLCFISLEGKDQRATMRLLSFK